MSDVTVAPAASPAPAANTPAPAAEVVVNPNPTQTPTPSTNTPPDKAPETSKTPGSRREAIQAAFDRAQKGKEPAKPAEAKRGHNNPPDDEPELPLDLKKPPKTEQPREQGRFARAPDAQAPANQKPGQPGQQQAPGQRQRAPVARLPEGTPYRDPPPRVAEHAKADWAAAPETVRGEFHRLAQETDNIHRAYRGDYEAMESIRPFQQMAEQHGTTLQRALTNYTSMEQKLRTDVVGGLDVIVNNLNLRTAEGQKIGLRDIAYHILNQSPEQHKLVQNSNAQTAQSHQIGQLHQVVQTLAQNFQQMQHAQQYERQFVQTRSAVDIFADTHPRFDELGELIEQELTHGYTLEEAYARADRLQPQDPTRAAQTRNPSAQTRQDKSISGAPESGPSNGTVRKKNEKDKPSGRRDAIERAIKRVNG
jgi:hypothetical protein